MGKRIKLYKCNAMVVDDELPLLITYAKIVNEYIFAGSKKEAISIFDNRHKTNLYRTVSEIKITPGLVIYKNQYNSNIEDNELTLSVDSGDKK